ncbi:MAG: T9SS type A sorting domain-containing protein [Phaeodactylibacter sp.]|nr:T9SS type A sorting domain-containing protein [Phaeodactylibacter sp.]
MKNKWKLALIFAFGIGGSSAFAQESANASGGDASGSGGTVAYSIGQVAYANQSGTNGDINQGVQQPYEIYSVGIDEEVMGIELSVFPNPTSDILNLQFEDFEKYDATIKVYDESGKIMYNSQIGSSPTTIDLSQYTTGIYLVNITSDSKSMKIFKIIKK